MVMSGSRRSPIPGDNSKMRVAPAVLAAAVAVAVAALASGCSAASQPGAGSPGGPGSGAASASSSPAGGAAAGSGAPGSPGATAGATGGASGSNANGAATPSAAGACATPGSYLVAIRTGRQATTDRIVFQFAGRLPSSYAVTPVPQVVGDASGKPVTIAGTSFLKVTFRGATAVCPATGHATYPGPSSATPNYAQLLGLAAAGDFEGYLTWGIGLAARGGYRAYTLTAPYRVVIDISHPAR
jgi:hypothetical protein